MADITLRIRSVRILGVFGPENVTRVVNGYIASVDVGVEGSRAVFRGGNDLVEEELNARPSSATTNRFNNTKYSLLTRACS